MTAYDYDVVYIGSGHGTFDGAIPLAAKGKHVAVIEADTVGGTCPNWGCNAKILLDQAVALQHTLRASDGIVSGDGRIDWAKNHDHKQAAIDGIPNMLKGNMESVGIKMYFGSGRLTDAHTVQVGDETLTAENIVISTGLRPRKLDVTGSELTHDSKEFMALTEMPKNLVVIGGGYIGVEFATMANAADANVTLVLHGDKALRGFHQPYVEQVLSDLEDRGVKIMRNQTVASLTENGSQIDVALTDGTITTDWVLDATGRQANVENLGLDELGIAYSDKGIKVNEYLQTAVPSVYASGDVIDKTQPKLTPTAQFESTYLMHRFAGESDAAIDYPAIATNVFTTPRIAQAGVTVAEAKAAPEQYTVQENDQNGNWYRAVDYEQDAKLTLIFNQQHQLVGATEISERAEDSINALLPAIEFGYTPEQLERLVYIFPSIGFDVYGQL
ncbi:glutathione reductase (NADPH) [Weissella uvarum]|uniref:dihydrolipoyl dehydrogenase family protein n=1 Tax=Weissella uvarum TaxID=1479233 RepID=UPI001960378D|nr:NAD(P)/FAD-dependent oxidoreductase [Weissella uvarum]MBM7617038.1 glutathione reductase (NADPH) [Weissella uvarum]MCM0595336.1 NAD(P)/FAD-dependent oxidoreductase [Weissella uvarum]